ncbi:MAG TPA: OmpA family protein [Polyangia bacterium]|jgi:chemotaxis protein MotB
MARVLPWGILAIVVGVGGAFYASGYRPLAADHARRGHDLARQTERLGAATTAAAALKEELGRNHAELERAGLELKQLQDDLARASEAKEQNDRLLEKLRADLGASGVEVTAAGGKIMLTMVDTILFGTGEAELTAPGRELLRGLGGTLKQTRHLIQVNGHTDDVPIKSELKHRFPTNWELSAARAINVARFLQDAVGVAPARLMPVGYGSYRPLAANRTARGRARNRRIEVLLVPVKLEVAAKK